MDTRLFLCGDVMTGRGIDQILPHSVDPVLYESYVRSARQYVALAEDRNGPVSQPVDFDYIWGDALAVWRNMKPDLRIINLETAVTLSDDALPKGINYRMHPDNVACLTAAQIDCCVLANNHVLDWGVNGLLETLSVMSNTMPITGAGKNAVQAKAPAVLSVPGRRVLVLAAGMASSGIPATWAATDDKPGVHFLPDLSDGTVKALAHHIESVREAGDLIVFSIHWGGNWGYDISTAEQRFAHALIDEAGVDVIHGHSSHHPKGIEVYRGRPILYGCGDFINDYEGIGGHEKYRGDLTLMYFPRINSDGELVSLTLTPLQIRQLSLHHASDEDAEWLRQRLDADGSKLNTGLTLNADNTLALQW